MLLGPATSGYSSCDQSSWVEWQMMESLSKKSYSYGTEFEFRLLFQKLVEIHLLNVFLKYARLLVLSPGNPDLIKVSI